jgi:hypothetical protein
MAKKKSEKNGIQVIKAVSGLEFLSPIDDNSLWRQDGFTCYMWALGTKRDMSQSTIDLCEKVFGNESANESLPGVSNIWRLEKSEDGLYKPYVLLANDGLFDQLATMHVLTKEFEMVA